MPRRRAPIAKSFSKSSRSNTPQSPADPPDAAELAGEAARVVVGTISRVHGLRGALVLAAPASARDALRAGMPVRLESPSRQRLDTRIERLAPHRTGYILYVEGIADRDAAEALIGRTLAVVRSELPNPAEREYYACDVLGATAYSTDGAELGTVVEIIATGANDVWVIRDAARELLVPAVAHAVVTIDLPRRRVVVDTSAAEAADLDDGRK